MTKWTGRKGNVSLYEVHFAEPVRASRGAAGRGGQRVGVPQIREDETRRGSPPFFTFKEILQRRFQVSKRRRDELPLSLQFLHHAVAETRRNERNDLRSRPERKGDARARHCWPLFLSQKRNS